MIQNPPGIRGGRLGDEANGEPVSTILKKIACHESWGGKQFHPVPEVPAGTAGLPIYGSGDTRGDVGIMQICYERTSAHVWNWVENVKQGAFLFRDGLERQAYEYLVDQVKPVLGFKNKTDEQLTEKERNQIRAEMRKHIREEAIHRYNTGGAGQVLGVE